MPQSSGQKRSSSERPRRSVASTKDYSGNEEDNEDEEDDDGKLSPAASIYFSQKYEHNVWPLIQAHLPCFIFRNNKFHLLNNDQKIVKTFDATSTDVLIEFMLQNGIPFAETLDPIAKEELTEEIASYHVPKCDLKNAQQGLNNFSQEDLKILSDQEIACILNDMGFIFRPDTSRGVSMFESLEEARVFVRANEDLFNSGSSLDSSHSAGRTRRVRKSSEQIEQRKKMLALRIWAATSPEPLPNFDWSKFGGSTSSFGAASAASSGATVATAAKLNNRRKTTGGRVAEAAQTTASRRRKPNASARPAPAAAAVAIASAQPGRRSQSSTSSRSNREAAPMTITAAGGTSPIASTSVSERKAAPKPPPVPEATSAAAAPASEPTRVSLPANRESVSAATATAPQQRPERKRIKKEPGAESNDEDDDNIDHLTTEEIEARSAALIARNESLKKFLRAKKEELSLKREQLSLRLELQAVSAEQSVQNDQQQ